MKQQKSLWDDARNMLVFYVLSNVDEFEMFRKSLDDRPDSSRLYQSLIVVIVENDQFKEILPEKPYFVYLSKSDFNFFGRIKNKEIKARFSQPFDLMLVYGKLKPMFVRLANKANAKKRVSIADIEGLKYDIRLSPQGKGFKQVAKYTKETLEKIQS